MDARGIYFTLLDCCDDADSDGWSECHECDDSDFTVHPDATEICDYRDNNCDTVIDEGFPTPGLTSGLTFGADRQTVTWNGEPVADRYDIVEGDIYALQSTGGDFDSSMLDCLEDDSGDTSASVPYNPAPGYGWYYLVRAVADCRLGSYDSGQPGQVGLRDEEVNASRFSCP